MQYFIGRYRPELSFRYFISSFGAIGAMPTAHYTLGTYLNYNYYHYCKASRAVDGNE